MRKYKLHVVFGKNLRKISLLLCLLFSTLGLLVFGSVDAASLYPNQPNQSSQFPQSQAQAQSPDFPLHDPSIPANTDTVSLNSSQLGWFSPFSFGVSRDALMNYTWNMQYLRKVNKHFAFAGLFEYGSSMYRLGGTLGFKFLAHNLFKFSAERLSQILPFTFDSGAINQRMYQDAVGARYQYVFADNHFFQDINLGGYYANTPSKWLDPVYFSWNGLSAINYRHIAGATSQGLDIASDVKLTRLTALSTHLFYDTVHYNKILNNPADSNNNSSGLGAGLGLKQLISDTLSFAAEADIRAIYATYKLGLSWLPPYLARFGFEITLSGQELIAHNDAPNNYGVGLEFRFRPSAVGDRKNTYQLPNAAALSDVESWTSIPAVHMEQVLAQAEQITQILQPQISAIYPPSGASGGGTRVTISGANLTNVNSVLFDGMAASGLQIVPAITATIPTAAVHASARLLSMHGSSLSPSSRLLPLSPPSRTPAALLSLSPSFAMPPPSAPNAISSITCITPPHTPGTVDVDITTVKGNITGKFTYVDVQSATALAIESIVPQIGSFNGGDKVVINGANFVSGATVKFGETPAKVIDGMDPRNINNALGGGGAAVLAGGGNAGSPSGVTTNQLTVITPPSNSNSLTGFQKVDVTVTNPDGQSITLPGGFTYVKPGLPQVTAVTPNSSGVAGGISVVIEGVNFIGVSAVKFGTVDAISYKTIDSTHINAIVPAGVLGKVNVTVVNAKGVSPILDANQFTYVKNKPNAVPTVISVSPTSGPLAGGTSVIITGTNFSGVTAVNFGTTAATSYTVDSPTQITAVSPAESAGIVDIKVTTSGGTSAVVAGDKFTYQAAPTVTAVNPKSGPLAGGTSVVITGTSFVGATAVQFGGTATSYVVNSATQITATSPAGSAGTVDITVTTTSGTSAVVAADQFTYQDVPTVTGVSPISGPLAGGTTVTITGTNFIGATGVKFGVTAGTSVTVVSATQITAKSPAGSAGTVDVTVTTTSGTSATSSVDQFTYQAAPTVTGVSPISGPLAGGTSVVITGTNFTGATAVKFGATAAASYTVDSPTQITAASPAETAATIDVRVTTPSGTSAVVAGDKFTYQNAPTVTAVNPKSGPLAGGTSVVITGTSFVGATAVQFGGTPATSYTINSATQITAVSPVGSAGTVDIRITTPSGTSAISAADQYTYQDVPTVIGLNPISGPLAGSTSVIITGTNFIGATGVKFGTAAAKSYVINSATQITASSAAGSAGMVDVTVITTSGTSATSSADQFTYQAAPTVTAVSPISGPLAGGTSVTITGTNFVGATAVKFGATAATSYIVNSPTQITATSPAGAAATINITVTTPSGTSAVVAGDKFTYQNAPTVTVVNPKSGPLAGGTSVVITGTNFIGATVVQFGGTPASSYTINSATQITATSPAESAGAVDITVTTTSGTSAISAADQYTYQDVPTVTGLNPISGPLAGSTSVVITGTNFIAATAVKFGGVAAKSYVVNSATQITASSAAGSAGTVDVTVTTTSGTSAIGSADQFTYQAAPTVTSISPISGPLAGGTSVTITGTNFIGATAVKFGTTAATSYIVNSPTQITATSPAGAAATIDVRVTTPSGTSAAVVADHFTYQAAPTVTVINPKSGPLAGGTSVVITGTNFIGATAVQFGGTPASSYTINSATQITASSPAGLAGAVDITVTTTSGTSTTSAADQFTYQDAPTVTGLNPISGPLAGSTSVVITGTNFVGATAVKFGATAAKSYVINSATQITASSAAGSAGTVDVTVTTTSGTSATSSADQFTYQAVSTVTAINPTSGPLAGGTSVTITGTNFVGATAVNFGTTAATSYIVNSPTQITAISPAEAAATIDVRVTTPSGTSAIVAADKFTYQDVPTVTVINPTSGSLAGGTSVVITGTNFIGATVVQFGSTAAASYVVNSATQITAISPAGSAGTVDITVTTTSGTSTVVAADQFTYQVAPTVTGVSPTSGPLAGSTSVIITGTNFVNVTAVKFGANAAKSYVINSPTQITASSAAGSAGTVDVTVTNTGGISATSSADQFTYQAVPTVTSVSPISGPLAGGTSVIITGTNFANVTAVKFGANAATSYIVNSPTQITATSPAGAAGTVDITITNTGGTSSAVAGDKFTYQNAPIVTSVSPTSGSASGGTSVTINGTNFIGATAVKFGTTAATSYVINSAARITANSPAGSVGAVVDITVTTTSGTSAVVAADKFTYLSNDATLSNFTISNGTLTPAFTPGTISYTDSVANSVTSVTVTPTADESHATIKVNGTTVTSGTPSAPIALNIGSNVITTVVTAQDGVTIDTYTVTVTRAATPITAIGAISGTPQVGLTLTAGAITPSGATVTYQWQESDTSGGTYTPISGATSSTYVPVVGDRGMYIEVVATGTGNYTGTVTSAPTATSVTEAITAIGPISGTPQVGSILTAGAITPSGATVSYQWQESPTSGGTYTPISGATSSTYVPAASDLGMYIEVVAIGTGNYTGSVTSAPTSTKVTEAITAIGAISGTPQVGSTLTAGAITPSGATVTYQWQESSTSGGTYTPISGATSSTYLLVSSDRGMYIKVVATGTGNYTGTVTSDPTATSVTEAITAIGAISGTPQVGSTLTAGAITPSGATVSYQWQESDTSGGTYTPISGATSSTYIPVVSDRGMYIRVVATGTGEYVGTVTSAPTATSVTEAITAIGAISGTPQVGSTLTAGAITPSGATVSYQWQESPTSGGTYTPISGATSSTYIPVASDRGMYIRVVATGTGEYVGTVTSNPTATSVTEAITAIGAISGTPQVGSTLTAGAITPSGATVSYQWQESDTSGGTYTPISGATSSTYVSILSDEGKYIEVVATGTGEYTGTVTSSYIGPVMATIILSPISLPNGIVGTAYSQTIIANGGTAPYTYNVTSGALPAGLNLDSSNGVISGTPTMADTYNFTITATDSYGSTGSQAYNNVVIYSTLNITTVSLPNGVVGMAYPSTIMAATGGDGSYTWGASNLPPGVNISTAGVISGTPTTATGSPFNVIVTVTDGHSNSSHQTYTVTITVPTITLSPSTLPNGTIGAPYSQIVTASGGIAPYTYTVSSGALPDGLNLDSGSGAITGTPTTEGNFNFTITATDNYGSIGFQDYNVAVGMITIIAAAGQHGSIVPSGIVKVVSGADQAFTITADVYYHIDDVLVDGVSVGAVSSYTFHNVTTNHIISATFVSDYQPPTPSTNIPKPNITSSSLFSTTGSLFSNGNNAHNTQQSQTSSATGTITSLSSSSGSIDGGSEVTIEFNGLGDVPNNVTFGGMAATIVSATANSVTVITPRHHRGAVDVVVANSSQSVSINNAFTYHR